MATTRSQQRKPAQGRTKPQETGRVIALTGTTEYLPSQLMSQAESDPSVRRLLSLDVREPIHQGRKTLHRQIDLTTPGAGAKLGELFEEHQVDTLVHAAFLSHPIHDSQYAHELQVIGTMHLLNAAARVGLKKIVLVGTTMAYGAHFDNPNYLTEKAPLKNMPQCPLINDLVEVEQQVARYAANHQETVITILRLGCLLGSHVEGFIPRMLARRIVPLLMGHDPLVQFLHESDALTVLQQVVRQDHPGIFNIVADGVLPWSTVLALGERIPAILPYHLANRLGSFLWTLQAIDAPPRLFDFLRYLWVADGNKARQELGFVARMTTLATVKDFFHLAKAKAPGVPSQSAGGTA